MSGKFINVIITKVQSSLGVTAQNATRGKFPEVKTVQEDSAASGRLRHGDQIVSIDGQTFEGQSYSAVHSKVRQTMIGVSMTWVIRRGTGKVIMGGISSSLSSLSSMTMSGDEDEDDDDDDDFALPGDNNIGENDEWDTDALSGMMFAAPAPEPQPEQHSLPKRGSVRRMSARFSQAAAVPEPEHHDASLPSISKTRRSSMRRADSSDFGGFDDDIDSNEDFGFGKSEKFGFDT